MPEEKQLLPFRTAAVLGSGVMGAQIAAHLANAGLQVILLDIPSKEGSKNTLVEGAFKKALKIKPNPFADSKSSTRIFTGNFEEHFELLGQAEWIIEVVIENLAIKQQLMERLEQVANEEAIISSNTSGLPICQIIKDRSQSFKKRFLGTHFFNPPRYLKLLEIIPTADTDPAVLDQIKWFGRVHLGKSIVVAKDTPNFIANRVGTYSMVQAIRAFTDGDYTIEEIDKLTGTLIGHPRSATFRTADVVGLDTLLYVGENLYKAIPHDESREGHLPPELLRQMVKNGVLGAKTKKGFYKKVGRDILSLNPNTMEYEPPKEMNLGDLKSYSKIANLKERFRAVYEDQGRAGAFTRQSTLDVIGYAARRIPEIADNPADIDRAMCWGFAWEMGPFEMWDVIGFDKGLNDLRNANIDLPQWVERMEKDGITSFYKIENGSVCNYVPGKGYLPEDSFDDHINLPAIGSDSKNILIKRKEAALLDLGDGVALYEFRSKANSLGSDVVAGIIEAIDYVEKNDFKGMVIGNSGKNFSVGANLGEAAYVLQEGKFDLLDQAVQQFQNMILRIRYARKPVVAALQGLALGGGCEVAMACANVVASLETYIGLVELGAGLIPAGCGTTHFAAKAAEKAASDSPSHIQPFLMNAFQTIATAKVAGSAYEAIELGYLEGNTKIIMNADRRIYAAREEIIRLFNQGYAPPPKRTAIPVLGQQGRAAMDSFGYQMQQGHFATEYDIHLAKQVAYIMTGGEISGPAVVDEDYLYKLEREAISALFKNPKTQERIKSILTTNKPLRN